MYPNLTGAKLNRIQSTPLYLCTEAAALFFDCLKAPNDGRKPHFPLELRLLLRLSLWRLVPDSLATESRQTQIGLDRDQGASHQR